MPWSSFRHYWYGEEGPVKVGGQLSPTHCYSDGQKNTAERLGYPPWATGRPYGDLKDTWVTIQVGKLKRLYFLSKQFQRSWHSPGARVRGPLLCLIALVQFFPTTVFAGEDIGCKDTMRIESHIGDRASGKVAEARGFLWQHWSERKCGELFLTTWSREGVRTNSLYRVNPVQHGILFKVNLSRADDASAPVDGLAMPASGSVKKSTRESTSYVVYSVERIKPETPYDIAKAKTIETTESVPPSKYRLRFKDKHGEVITDF